VCLKVATTATFKHTSFTGSCAENGGAVAAYGGSIITFEHNTFIGNTATVAGGAVFSHGCSLSFSGNTSFISNRAAQNGGAVYFGALEMDHYRNISFQGWNSFTTNLGSRGGAIFVQMSALEHLPRGITCTLCAIGFGKHILGGVYIW